MTLYYWQIYIIWPYSWKIKSCGVTNPGIFPENYFYGKNMYKNRHSIYYRKFLKEIF